MWRDLVTRVYDNIQKKSHKKNIPELLSIWKNVTTKKVISTILLK